MTRWRSKSEIALDATAKYFGAIARLASQAGATLRFDVSIGFK
jgi:hypothetical protein